AKRIGGVDRRIALAERQQPVTEPLAENRLRGCRERLQIHEDEASVSSEGREAGIAVVERLEPELERQHVSIRHERTKLSERRKLAAKSVAARPRRKPPTGLEPLADDRAVGEE